MISRIASGPNNNSGQAEISVLQELASMDPGEPGEMSPVGDKFAYTAGVLAGAAFAENVINDSLHTAIETDLKYEATHDKLTGLLNQETWLGSVASYVENAENGGNPHFGVIFIDLDRFKEVNDGSGHLAGNEVLVGIAKKLLESLRGSDVMSHLSGRIGGDEFGILVDLTAREGEQEDMTDKERLEKIEERLKGEETGSFTDVIRAVLGNGLDISTGIATWNKGLSASDLVRLADQNMYSSKRSKQRTSGDAVQFY